MEQETVYDSSDDSHVVMCEKVQSLAGSVYQELERMIAKYDEDVVKNLMPLVVNILESLDFSYTENQEHEVELELLREDNEQLVTQYEREKQLRRASEQKLFELEDHNEEQLKQSLSKIESLESIVRMFELKTRNASDHVARLEEKEDTMRKEYAKLHDRYTELFKTHMDYMERTKILLGTDRPDQLSMLRPKVPLGGLQNNSMTRSAGPLSFQLHTIEPRPAASSATGTATSASGGDSEQHLAHGPSSLQAEIEDAETAMERLHTAEKGQTTDVTMATHDAPPATNTPTANATAWDREMSMDDVTPDHEDMPSDFKPPPSSNTTKRSEHRSANNLYQELSFQDAVLEVDDGADITGGWVHPGEYASSESDDEEEESRPTSASAQRHASDNFFGMGREVENLIMENNELLATKNALNIVKDDLIAKVDELTGEQEILREEVKSQQTVRSRLQLRLQELEEELKKIKEDAEKANNKETNEEDDIPMAQRKRFTRVEMARVLMERNQYKERFMELQEAVRWTEMIRASKSDGQGMDKKSKQGIWKFFSNLFSTTDSRPSSRGLPSGNMLYDAPSNSVSPAEPGKRRAGAGGQERKRGLDFLDTDISSEKLQQRRATERREQYKQVRAHVKKDDGRMQAYGWSLPAKVPSAPSAATPQGKQESHKSSHVPVPVPVYCRPLMEKEQGMKIWCAAGVNLTGGRTRDGGSIVGASVFYSGDCAMPGSPVADGDEVEQLSQQLKDQEQIRTENETLDQSLSSLVWICTSTHNASKVTVIEANNPADVLQSFPVCSSHLLCIASVPGAMESDYVVDGELARLATEEPAPAAAAGGGGSADDVDGAGQEGRMATIRLVSCATGETAPPASGPPSGISQTDEIRPVLRKEVNTGENAAEKPSEDAEAAAQDERRFRTSPTDDIVKDGLTEGISEPCVGQEEEKMSSVLPTMWLGSQSGCVYVHSAKAQWKRCIHSIRLKDSVLSIVHVKGRVLASLADGTVAIFHRGSDGQWDLTNYHLLDLGQPQHSIRCMTVVQENVWCGCRNRVHVINPKTMQVQTSFDAHPRRESQLRQMAWLGDGVWVSIRLDSTLRLYHAHTQQHLQDVDIEPYVSKMLGTGKLGFSFVRITALLISSSRLWIGTGNGVVISVPLNADGSACRPPGGSGGGAGAGAPRLPGGVVRVYSDTRGEQLTPASFIPYCHMAHAQLSFHGHRDAVKFFVAVPGSGGLSSAVQSSPSGGGSGVTSAADQKPRSLLVMSGGEGYIDFRIGESEEDEDIEESADKPRSLSRGERSHLIVWQVSVPD